MNNILLPDPEKESSKIKPKKTKSKRITFSTPQKGTPTKTELHSKKVIPETLIQSISKEPQQVLKLVKVSGINTRLYKS